MSKLKVLDGATHEIVMQREFDAPRHLVIRAMSTPALIRRWYGGVRAEVLEVDVDYRVGGSYRYVFQPHGGEPCQFTGTYREISDDRVVFTERFNDLPEESVVTTTLTETGGKTTLHLVISFSSAAIRDMVAGTGMAEGAGESYDKLEELLATLA